MDIHREVGISRNTIYDVRTRIIIKTKLSDLFKKILETNGGIFMTREGYIRDFISGVEVKATPEELEAVQVFSKQLVEDYNYPKENIQTRPEYRVKVRPSDTKKEYPVDIAVFTNRDKQEDNIHIIVECKKRSRKDGKSQLKDYLRFSKAYLGVWFNGAERLFLRKVEKDGRIDF